MRDDAWFRPKSFGWGATPTTWQGWAVLGGFVALLALDLKLVQAPGLKVGLAIVLAVAVSAISWAKTDGAWRWRWGGDDW